jgi:hypothetical protein
MPAKLYRRPGAALITQRAPVTAVIVISCNSKKFFKVPQVLISQGKNPGSLLAIVSFGTPVIEGDRHRC